MTTINGPVNKAVVLGQDGYGSSLTVSTSGRIDATSAGAIGVYSDLNGSYLNNSGVITGGGEAGVYFRAAGTIVNSGKIYGSGFVGGAGVILSGGADLDNTTTGIIGAGYGGTDGSNMGVDVKSGTLTNHGLIIGGVGAEVYVGGTLDNFGTIRGFFGGIGVSLGSYGTLTIEVGSKILGGDSAYSNGGAGLVLQQGAQASNNAYIKGGKSYSYGVGGSGVAVYLTASFTNFGQVLGGLGGAGTQAAHEAGGVGLYVHNSGHAVNDGTVMGGTGGATAVRYAASGAGGAGARVNLYGTLTNSAGHSITGGSGANNYYHEAAPGGAGVFMNGGTLTNAGTITGGSGTGNGGQAGDAVQFGSGNAATLIVDPGAVFNGAVVANTTVKDVLDLSGTSAATLNGLGSQFTGFSTVEFGAGADWRVNANQAAFRGNVNPTLQGFAIGDTIDIAAVNLRGIGTQSHFNPGSDVLSIYQNVAPTINLQFGGSFSNVQFHVTSDGTGGVDVTLASTACYRRGTQILTLHGEALIEALRIGDRVVTQSGEAKPIRWIGRRSYSGFFAMHNPDVLPIRIRAGALADGVPTRDLWVSPEHALWTDGMLIPAGALINDLTIFQEDTDATLTYFHLEFEQHELIVAEGALAESYVDDESRAMFDNAAEYQALYPRSTAQAVVFCAPRAEDGAVVDMTRRRIAARGCVPPVLRLELDCRVVDKRAAV